MQKTDLQFVMDVVRAAATLMDRTGGFEVRDKGARENIVTSSDLAVQHWLTEQLRLRFPDIGFLCEEEDLSDIQGHEAVWVIDPIDGTLLSLDGKDPSPFKPSLVIGANCHASAWRVLDTVRKHLPALPY